MRVSLSADEVTAFRRLLNDETRATVDELAKYTHSDLLVHDRMPQRFYWRIGTDWKTSDELRVDVVDADAEAEAAKEAQLRGIVRDEIAKASKA